MDEKEKAKQFSQICSAFCETIRAKYSGMNDVGILLVAVNANDQETVSRQTLVVGDGTALTYGLIKSFIEKDAVKEVFDNAVGVMKLSDVFGLNCCDENDNEG